MLIGIDSSPCSLSLRNRSVFNYEKMTSKWIGLKKCFWTKIFFSISSIPSIPIMLIGIHGGYFPAICRVCLRYVNMIYWSRAKFEATSLFYFGKFCLTVFFWAFFFVSLLEWLFFDGLLDLSIKLTFVEFDIVVLYPICERNRLEMQT